ncbi:4Fe-4S binding protein [Natranaerofaba carboxydovora]|uniref:4Fe-4S binding protein n=1 Tax=Natranaerofaba carboxydovora TaxID=2742683 RepID=UPI001F12D9D6|nr:4Fe-4S binding protein [Natranaerofaba carboxydovora]UMZ72901.1 putative ferredoxin-like protein YdhY [Natranaerofaba carboxydovora]
MEFLTKVLDRRKFLKTSGAGIALTAVGMSLSGCGSEEAAMAEGELGTPKKVLTVDNTRCVGCRRCEFTCSVRNTGNSGSVVSGIKVDRNYNFGPEQNNLGIAKTEGKYGNGRVMPENCNQCKDPVPCAEVCPQDAIVNEENTGARMVSEDDCIGCGECVKACPWEMITIDPDNGVAAKCFLCYGSPQCATECPVGAIELMTWRDLSDRFPVRNYSSIFK